MFEAITNNYGSNIKKIRKDLGFRQYEIAGEEITRNLISLIENNKTPLNEKTAKIIARNINKLAKEKNIDIYIEDQDFFNIERYQAKLIADQYIEEITNYINNEENYDFISKIREVENFLSQWDIPYKKLITYEIIGDFFYKKNDCNQSFMFYIKSFENAIRLENSYYLLNLITKIGRCYIKLGKYQEALNFNNIALAYSKDYLDEFFLKISFNNALAYKNLNLPDNAIEQINNIENMLDKSDITKYTDLLILKALCYKNKKSYDSALEIYNKIISFLDFNYIQKKLIVYSNIMDIYCELNDKEKILEYIKNSIYLLNKIDSMDVYIPKVYIQVALGYKRLQNFTLSKDYFNEALNLSEKINDLQVKTEAISNLIDLYIMEHDTKKIDDLKEIIIDLVSKNLLDFNNDLIFKLILFYNNLNKPQESNKIISFILNKKQNNFF